MPALGHPNIVPRGGGLGRTRCLSETQPEGLRTMAGIILPCTMVDNQGNLPREITRTRNTQLERPAQHVSLQAKALVAGPLALQAKMFAGAAGGHFSSPQARRIFRGCIRRSTVQFYNDFLQL